MTDLKVFFNELQIKNKGFYSMNQVQNKPYIKYNLLPNKYYTVIMFDVDVPSKDDINRHNLLHWLVINNNEEIIKYLPPSPPFNVGPHRYYIYLYEQVEKMKISYSLNREDFDPIDFATKNSLLLVDGVMFLTENK